MIDISKEETRYLRKNGCSQYITVINRQSKANKKSHAVEDNDVVKDLLKKYWTDVVRVIYDSLKEHS